MNHLYTVLVYFAMPFVLLRLAVRGFSNRGYWRNVPERFGFRAPALAQRPVWIHAVSVGEVQAAALLCGALERALPGVSLLVTVMTPTGRERASNAFGENAGASRATVRYLPYDLPDALARFLSVVQPRALVLMETELWPNLVRACAGRKVPVVLANARMSSRSAAGYARVAGLTGELLARLSAIAAQGEDDARRLMALGAPRERVEVTGSVKFDMRLPVDAVHKARALRRRLGRDRLVWIAASTHPEEEDAVLDACARVRQDEPNALLVLVPRHPERFEPVVAACRTRGFRTARRSEHLDGDAALGSIDVLVGDTMGELLTLYGSADVAFVGGSLTPTGGHNMLEPAALDLPVLCGPHVFNFADIARGLSEAKAMRQVADAPELAREVLALLRDSDERARMGERAGRFVEANRGASERVAHMICAGIDRGIS